MELSHWALLEPRRIFSDAWEVSSIIVNTFPAKQPGRGSIYIANEAETPTLTTHQSICTLSGRTLLPCLTSKAPAGDSLAAFNAERGCRGCSCSQ
jgi:hypothetical protein